MIYFVGAGPGAPDLITVRGARLLAAADLVIYAGSLVNPELLELCKPNCEVYDSAGLTLEEMVELMCACEARGGMCVRLHTGDPALYGAHREQMDALDACGVPYEVVPGVSSLFAAAAALQVEYTVPEVSQSLIVTRVEGRTPVPERERLRAMAAHGCTLVLFLSAGLLEKAQEELLAGGYAPGTPAALVYRASWPDEALYPCTVGTLVQCAEEHGVRKTALVVVGEALGAHRRRSRLYDPCFSHGYREAREKKGYSRSFPEVQVDCGCCSPGKKGSIPSLPEPGGDAMRIEAVAFTSRGLALAERIAAALRLQGDEVGLSCPPRLAGTCGATPYESLDAWAQRAFAQADALLFVGACGIAVRAIAPHVLDKFSDPAVVCVDEAASYAIPLLSGHVGGANELARRLAGACGAQPVITTATDVNGSFAVDEWAANQGLTILDRARAKEVSAALLEGRPVGFASAFAVEGPLPAGLVAGDAARARELGISVSLDAQASPFPHTLHLVPRVVTVGVGCRRGASLDLIAAMVDACLDEAGVCDAAVSTLASIDVKADEPGLRDLAAGRGWGLRFHTAEELAAVEGDFASSEFVQKIVGVDNVCERAACACGETLLLPKRSGAGVTVALGLCAPRLAFSQRMDDIQMHDEEDRS